LVQKYGLPSEIGWGVGGATIGAGVAGAVLGLAAISDHYGNDQGLFGGHVWPDFAIVGAAAAIGAVAGFFINKSDQDTIHQQRELTHEDAVVGKPLARYQQELTAQYDHDGNGVITNGPSPTGLQDHDERLTQNTAEFTRTNYTFSPHKDIWGNDHLFQKSTDTIPEVQFVSAAAVWTAADANHDGSVSKQEMTSFLKQYDTNGDGNLDAGERAQIFKDHPLVAGAWQSSGQDPNQG
jgi:hypothetical protein